MFLSADSDARYAIIGMTRFNGDYGCTFCYVVGLRIAEQQPPIYPFDDGDAADRTHDEMRNAGELAHDLNAEQRGVKAISALSILEGFDLRTGQLVEAMHCLWEGNFKRLFEILVAVRNAVIEGNITPGQLATNSERITSINGPTKLARYARDLMHFADFTATELRNLAWCYWLPCAQDFLNADRRHLCAIFAEATFILNKDLITVDELERAENLLEEYRMHFEQYFPREQLVYNVHLLKHNVRCVREIGPVWVASGFRFESLNR